MGLFSRINAATVIEGDSPASPTGWLARLMNAATTHAGVQISESNALTVADVYKCVRVISETGAMLPLKLYKRTSDGGRKEAVDHPLYALLHDEPNEHMTSFTWREVIFAHLLLWGRHASYIERDGFGQAKALWPIAPDRWRWEVKDGVRWFYVQTGGGQTTKFWDDEILWIPGLTRDGYNTYSPVQLHRETLGLSKATETYGAKFFGNGGRPIGTLNHPGKLSKEAQQRLKDQFKEQHGSLDAALRLMVLEEGLKFDSISIAPDDAQFLETRKFQRGEVAGLYRVPPHKIGDLERSTNNNIEHQDLEFLRDTMMPWLERVEQAMCRCLLIGKEKKKFYAEHDVKGFMRGDMAARTAFYKAMWQMGAYSANRALKAENEEPVEGGDRLYVPVNYVPTDKVDEFIAKGGAKTLPAPKEGEN